MTATEYLKKSLEVYFKKYGYYPKRIEMALGFYNKLCKEDEEGVINAMNETVFGIPTIFSDCDTFIFV